MAVPLVARGRTLGAITLALSESGRRYRAQDLVLARDLARRAALAVDNSALYKDAELARRDAELANRAKDEFLATLSHELRTPLTSMLGWVRMLRAGQVEPDRQAHALEVVERNTRLQAQLIDDLLDVSRIILGKLELDKRPVDLVTVVTDAVESMRREAEARGVALHSAMDGAAGPVLGDATRLQQIVVNLLSNAVKFTPAGGRVDVRLERHQASARIVVADTGQGIDPEYLPHLFDRFWQAEGTSRRRHGGLGLGLAIVRHLVGLHGGTVSAASPGPGQGATFVVALPVLAVAGDRLPSEGRGTPPLTRLEGVRVLIVDDDQDSGDLVRVVLDQAGADVVVATSADEAFDLFRQSAFDVIVSDIEMPGADGYDLLRRVRDFERSRFRRAVSAIALTAYASGDDRRRVLASGFQMHAPKPIDPVALVGAVAAAAGWAPR
jgi:signal transduction histidine kinase/CheY-like chemotaxis protein